MFNLFTPKSRAFATAELTLVAAIVLGLAVVVFAVFLSYRSGAERSKCVTNIASIQRAVRSFQTTNNLPAGEAFEKSSLVGKDKVFESEPTCPSCDSAYVWSRIIPDSGKAMATCPKANKNGHIPSNTDEW